MKNRRLLAAFLCLILIFTMLFTSCFKETEDPTESPNPQEGSENNDPLDASQKEEYSVSESLKRGNLIMFVTYYKTIERPYALHEEITGWRGSYDGGLTNWESLKHGMEFKEYNEGDYPLEPGDKVVKVKEIVSSRMHVSPAVYEILEGWDISKQQFLICNFYRLKDSETECAKEFEAKCKEYFPDMIPIGDTQYYLWEGTAEDFKAVSQKIMNNEQSWKFMACLYEDFLDIYGATVEQALVLIQNGHFDDMCLPKSESPLYGLTPTQIAAYLAEHPELLEENA